MSPPSAFGPDNSTRADPDTHTLRCNGVAPIDGDTVADSPVRVTVTTVPSANVLVTDPSGNGTNVSALAAPTDKNPTATAATDPTDATCSPRRRPTPLKLMKTPLRKNIPPTGGTKER